MKLNNWIEVDSPQHVYPEILKALRDQGSVVSPRGMKTYEAYDVVMKLDPHNVLVTGINRGTSTKLISMEALQLISGTSYPRRTIAAAGNMAKFTDGEVFHGAYGTRIRPQLHGVIDRLLQDRDSRQAVITIWDPLHDTFLHPQARDVPCTTMLQFLIRDDKLIMHVTMRSNDAWWGLPHDWGQFSQLHMTIANVLNVEPGDYFHHVVSFHLYDRDVESIDKLTAPTQPPTLLNGIGLPGDSLAHVQQRAETLLRGELLPNPTASELWHQRIQHSVNQSIANA